MISVNQLISSTKSKFDSKKELWNLVLSGKVDCVLLGVNEQSECLLDIIKVSAIIDDYTDNKIYKSVPIIKLSDLSGFDDAIFINCVLNTRPVTALTKLLTYGASKILNYTEVMYFDNRVRVPYFICETRDLFDLEALTRVYSSLSDDKSKVIFNDVLSYRISGDLSFMSAYKYLPQNQYIEEFMSYDNEVFVDAGGFDGDTAELFLSKFPSTNAYYLLEPDKYNIEKARKRLKSFKQVIYIDKGASDKKEELNFKALQGSSSTVSEDGDTIIKVDAIDNMLNKAPTTVKMDIEGHELRALFGMKNIIKKYCPKLAICVYHKGDDFYKVHDFVMSINGNYSVYLRHYSESFTETVMYFVPH